MFICPCCAISSFSTLKELLRHVCLAHSDQDDFMIQCNFQGCSRTFRKLRTFENHIYAFHDVNEGSSSHSAELIIVNDEDYGYGDEHEDTEGEEVQSEADQLEGEENELHNICLHPITGDPEKSLQQAAAFMILKTREKHKIPLSVMNSIVNDVQSLFDIAITTLSAQIHTYLESCGTSKEVAEGIDQLIKNSPGVFEGLKTQQQQLSFFRSNFNLIVSIFVGSKLLYSQNTIGFSTNYFGNKSKTTGYWFQAQGD